MLARLMPTGWRTLVHVPNLAFVLATLAGLLSVFAFGGTSTPLPLAVIAGAGVLFILIGLFGYEHVKDLRSRLLYFGVQLALVLTALLAARMDAGIWLLVLPLASQAVQQPLRFRIAFYALVLLAFGGVVFGLTQSIRIALTSMIQFASGLAFIYAFTEIAQRESKARAEIEQLAVQLREANLKLSEYATQADELATTRERNRLAREIHDTLGHYLTVTNVQLAAANVLMVRSPAQAQDAIEKAQAATKNGLAEVRRSVSALRQSPLEGRSLPEALRLLLRDSDTSGVQSSLQIVGDRRALSPQVEMTLYRAMQEALTNVRKHAPHATRVDAQLIYAAGSAGLRVQDDGHAQATSQVDAGFGLIGLRERAQLLGGTLRSVVEPDGFTLEIEVPA